MSITSELVRLISHQLVGILHFSIALLVVKDLIEAWASASLKFHNSDAIIVCNPLSMECILSMRHNSAEFLESVLLTFIYLYRKFSYINFKFIQNGM